MFCHGTGFWIHALLAVLTAALLVPAASAGVVESWVARFDGDASFRDGGRDIVAHPAGGCFVVGTVSKDGSSDDCCVTIRYAADGESLWVRHYDADTSRDWGRAIELYPSGGVVVAGTSHILYCTNNTFVARYDEGGLLVWDERPTLGYPQDVGGLAVSESGETYVACRDNTCGYIVTKYEPDGDEAWCSLEDYSTEPKDITVDSDGCAYVTGEWGCPLKSQRYGGQCGTVKYRSGGSIAWTETENYRKGKAVAVDGMGNVYVGGFRDYSSWDFCTIKYDSTGSHLWEAIYDGPDGSNDTVQDLALDGSGNVYVVGDSYGSETDMDWALVKYDSEGNEQWARRYDGPGSGQDWPRDMEVTEAGDVFIVGSAEQQDGDTDLAMRKYDRLGNLLWTATYDGPGGGYDEGYAVALAPDGAIYVTGRSVGLGTDQDLVVIRYDENDTAVEPIPDIVDRTALALYPPEPNPTRGDCQVHLFLPAEAGPVRLRVCDVAGRIVRTLIDRQSVSPGPASATWDGRDREGHAVGSGVYFLVLEVASQSVSQKLVLLR